MMVIPNKMGIVMYHPSAATNGLCKQTSGSGSAGSDLPSGEQDSLPSTGGGVRVSWKAEAFCRHLVKQYRVNLLDHAVFQDKGIRVAGSKDMAVDSDKLDVNFFRLGMAAMNGDVKQVRKRGP